jgi:Na+/proline symporter
VTTTPTLPAASFTTEKWISHFTLLFGLLAAVPVAFFHGLHWGAGILVGAILAWFNFRWLKQGLDALTAASTAQADHPKPQVPLGTYFTAAFRYGLIGLAVYVIFKYLNVPVLSMIVGLCALGAATMAVSVYEILRPQE